MQEIVTQMLTQLFIHADEFPRIEQSLGLKVSVTLGGMVLIGIELWWFLLSKIQGQLAEAHQEIQEVIVKVDGGYEPEHVVVKAGQPVRLNFLRRDPSSCLEKVLFPEFQITEDLVLNQVTSIELMPEKPGQYSFRADLQSKS